MYYICVHFFIKKTIEVLLNFNFIIADDNLESKYYIQVTQNSRKNVTVRCQVSGKNV
jgi:hypothetical protein